MHQKLITICLSLLVIASSNLAEAFFSAPATTFMPDYKNGNMVLKGTSTKSEEELDNGCRSSLRSRNGGFYYFRKYANRHTWGLGGEYIYANADQQLDHPNVDGKRKLNIEIETLAPSIYWLTNIIDSSDGYTLAVSLGYSRQLTNIEGSGSFQTNLFRAGVLTRLDLFSWLSVVPFVEYAQQGHGGFDLIGKAGDYSLSLGLLQTFFGTEDGKDRTRSFSLGVNIPMPEVVL